MSFISLLSHNIINLPGWHTQRHILVIESDDWGSIRMPSKEVYAQLLSRGIRVDKDSYCRYDSLASVDDLSALFDVLTSVKDKNGRNAVLTADAVVANPDFEKIRDNGFLNYYYEPFTTTLKRSKDHEGSFELWRQGIAAGIFHPQFHGREHLNVKKWLRNIQSGDETTRLAFDYGTFGLSHKVDASVKNYMGAFNSGLNEDIVVYEDIITEGLNLFEQLFGYKSESFIATRYTWSPKIEPILKKNGVNYLQGMVSQIIPLDDDQTFVYKKNNFCGKKSENGLTYLMRNCYFEPSQGGPSAQECLNRVKIAFRWHKPATISMHRLNVIGSIDENNRTRNLKELKWLLDEIVKLYPDVEFMSSDELGRVITSRKD